jgi:hypothetical protein
LNRRKTQQRARTAYQEAGQAIVAIHEGIKFHHVTIMAQDDSLGHVLYRRTRSFNRDLDSRPATLIGIYILRHFISLQSECRGRHLLKPEIQDSSWLGPPLAVSVCDPDIGCGRGKLYSR